MDELISPDAEDFYWNIGCRDCNLNKSSKKSTRSLA